MSRKNWFADSATMQSHRECQDEARLLWEDEYGEAVPCNITLALEWLAEIQGHAKDHYVLVKAITPAEIVDIVTGKLICPECGSVLDFELLASYCPTANPRGYTGLFLCSREECQFHFYTVGGLLDVRNSVLGGGWPKAYYPDINYPTTKVVKAVCPVCGSKLFVESIPACRKINPRGYKYLHYCSDELCPYHVFESDDDVIIGVL